MVENFGFSHMKDCLKLDGVGGLIIDPPPTRSTLLSKTKNYSKRKLHLTRDMLHVTRIMISRQSPQKPVTFEPQVGF